MKVRKDSLKVINQKTKNQKAGKMTFKSVVAFVMSGMMFAASPVFLKGVDEAGWINTLRFSMNVNADESDVINYFKFDELEDGTVEIKKYTGTATSVVVPDQIEGRTVSGIGKSAFEDCIDITSIQLPNTLIRIGDKAFYNCQSLYYFDIPNSVEYIGMNAFGTTAYNDPGIPWYSKLVGEVYFGRIFYSYKGKMPESTRITLKKGTKLIAPGALFGCTNLEEIDMSDQVAEIGKFALKNCTGLKKVVFSDTLKEIGTEAFRNCQELEELKLPDSLTTIHDYAFRECKKLESVYIPKNAVYISKTAFLECTNLKNFIFSENCDFDAIASENFFDNFNIGSGMHGESTIKNVIITKEEGGKGISDNPFGNNFAGTYMIEDGIEFSDDAIDSYVVFKTTDDNGNYEIVSQKNADDKSLPKVIPLEGVQDGGSEEVGSTKIGDVNGDGNVDVKDSALMKRHLAGWDVKIDESVADVNGDGNIDVKDSALVKRLLAGWDVVLGKK